MKIRRLILRSATVLALLALVLYLFRVPLVMELVKRVAAQHMAVDPIKTLPDGLHVGLCGAGSPFPDEKRLGPCTLVLAGQRLFVFDAGAGASRNIGKMDFNAGRIEAIFLTHFHSDHIDGLGELLLNRWVTASNTSPVPVFGPQGVEAVIAGLTQAYALDKSYRVAHHGDATLPASGSGGQAMPFAITPTAAGEGRATVLNDGGVEVVAFLVDHKPIAPAVGYRISYKGRSVVISGDTQKSAAVQREAAGVDVLVHEAMSTPLMALLKDAAAQSGRNNFVKIFDDVLNYHSSPEQAAETARDAKARYLLLNHIAPPLPFSAMEKAFLGGAADLFNGPIRVGRDGDFISLPAGSADIHASRRF